MTLAGFFLITIAAMAILMLLSGWYTRLLTGQMVYRKLTWIEEIFDTGEPPAGWKARNQGITCRDIRRLDRLRKYLVRTTLTVDETTREEVAKKLTETREQWVLRVTQ